MIIASAIKHKGIVFTGVRHNQIIEDLITLGIENPIAGEQGFIRHNGEFMSRENAKTYAVATGQITETLSTKLSSADLW